MEIAKLQFITNYRSDISHLNQVKAVVKAGVKWVQYRPKHARKADIIAEGQEIAAFCKQHSVVFIMNDSIDISLQLNTDGVHLGNEDMPPKEARKILGNNKIIGGTANTIEDVICLINQGVNYVGLGPYQFTETKKNLSPVIGVKGYEDIIKGLNNKNLVIPIIAIGGIKSEDIKGLLNTEVHGIAISSLISDASNIHKKTTALLNLF
ncbi:MAG: thiamine phosphate synthase [Bacteroidetes bacterium]|nr:thiamine phosphate synthase [Bacteroidota bacterium]